MKTPEKVTSISALLKRYGRPGVRTTKISSCSGSFDLLHAGHISYLKEARSKGDVLVVFLNTDESIKKYKGSTRPIVPFTERAILLAAISFVDHIVPLSELNPVSLIESLKPEVFCNGADWGQFAAERSVVEDNGGRFVIVSAKTRSLMSTSDLVSKVALAHSTKLPQAVFIENSDLSTLLSKGDLPTILLWRKTITKLAEHNWKIVLVDHKAALSPSLAKKILRDAAAAGIMIDHALNHPLLQDPRDTSIFEKAATTLNLPLSKCWHISYTGAGTMSARLANMKTVIISKSPSRPESTLTRPDFTTPSVDKILGHIRDH